MFATKMISRTLKYNLFFNLKLKLKHPFVFGFTLENLSGKSTDLDWIAQWVENVTVVHKLVSLKNFAVYWNPNDKFLEVTLLTEK